MINKDRCNKSTARSVHAYHRQTFQIYFTKTRIAFSAKTRKFLFSGEYRETNVDYLSVELYHDIYV